MISITNQKNFLKSLNEFSEKSGLLVGLIAKKFAFSAFKSVIQKTPVETGRARAAWNIEEGKVDLSVPQKDEFTGKSKTISSRYNNKQLAKTFSIENFPVFFITNDLDYIVFLEDGRSKQSDRGFMVARTIVQMQAEAASLSKVII